MFAKRLERLRTDKELTHKEMADMLGITRQAYGHYESGKRQPDYETLTKLAAFFGVTTDYLLGRTGTRTSLAGETTTPPIGDIGFISDASKLLYGKDTASTLDLLNVLEDNQTQLIAAGRPLTPDQRVNLIRALDPDKPATPIAQVPIVATIRAGIPILTEEHISGYLDLAADTRADFAVQIRGDSMIWAGVHEGDYALCRESEAAHTGQMVVAAVQDPAASDWGGTIKYFVQANGRKILRAANPEYKDITLGPEDRIVGIVVAVLKDNPPALHTYEDLVAITTGRGQEWASLAVTAASIGWTPREIEEMLKIMAKVPGRVKE